MIVAVGTTNLSIAIRVVDDAGLPVTGLDDSTLPDIYWSTATADPTQISLSDLASAGATYSSGGVYELGSGLYRLDIPNAALAAAGTVHVLGEDEDMHVLSEPIQVLPALATIEGIDTEVNKIPRAGAGGFRHTRTGGGPDIDIVQIDIPE